MEKRYYFIYNEVSAEFEAIQKIDGTQFLHLNMVPNESAPTTPWYSVTTLTEESARKNFTLTGYLPSAIFEELMEQAKEEEL